MLVDSATNLQIVGHGIASGIEINKDEVGCVMVCFSCILFVIGCGCLTARMLCVNVLCDGVFVLVLRCIRVRGKT